MTKPPDFTDADFKTSSYTGNGTDCVEAALRPGGASLRDSKNQAGPRLVLSEGAWTAFLRQASTDHYGRQVDYTALKKKRDLRTQQAG